MNKRERRRKVETQRQDRSNFGTSKFGTVDFALFSGHPCKYRIYKGNDSTDSNGVKTVDRNKRKDVPPKKKTKGSLNCSTMKVPLGGIIADNYPNVITSRATPVYSGAKVSSVYKGANVHVVSNNGMPTLVKKRAKNSSVANKSQASSVYNRDNVIWGSNRSKTYSEQNNTNSLYNCNPTKTSLDSYEINTSVYGQALSDAVEPRTFAMPYFGTTWNSAQRSHRGHQSVNLPFGAKKLPLHERGSDSCTESLAAVFSPTINESFPFDPTKKFSPKGKQSLGVLAVAISPSTSKSEIQTNRSAITRSLLLSSTTTSLEDLSQEKLSGARPYSVNWYPPSPSVIFPSLDNSNFRNCHLGETTLPKSSALERHLVTSVKNTTSNSTVHNSSSEVYTRNESLCHVQLAVNTSLVDARPDTSATARPLELNQYPCSDNTDTSSEKHPVGDCPSTYSYMPLIADLLLFPVIPSADTYRNIHLYLQTHGVQHNPQYESCSPINPPASASFTSIVKHCQVVVTVVGPPLFRHLPPFSIVGPSRMWPPDVKSEINMIQVFSSLQMPTGTNESTLSLTEKPLLEPKVPQWSYALIHSPDPGLSGIGLSEITSPAPLSLCQNSPADSLHTSTVQTSMPVMAPIELIFFRELPPSIDGQSKTFTSAELLKSSSIELLSSVQISHSTNAANSTEGNSSQPEARESDASLCPCSLTKTYQPQPGHKCSQAKTPPAPVTSLDPILLEQNSLSFSRVDLSTMKHSDTRLHDDSTTKLFVTRNYPIVTEHETTVPKARLPKSSLPESSDSDLSLPQLRAELCSTELGPTEPTDSEQISPVNTLISPLQVYPFSTECLSGTHQIMPNTLRCLARDALKMYLSTLFLLIPLLVNLPWPLGSCTSLPPVSESSGVQSLFQNQSQPFSKMDLFLTWLRSNLQLSIAVPEQLIPSSHAKSLIESGIPQQKSVLCQSEANVVEQCLIGSNLMPSSEESITGVSTDIPHQPPHPSNLTSEMERSPSTVHEPKLLASEIIPSSLVQHKSISTASNTSKLITHQSGSMTSMASEQRLSAMSASESGHQDFVTSGRTSTFTDSAAAGLIITVPEEIEVVSYDPVSTASATNTPEPRYPSWIAFEQAPVYSSMHNRTQSSVILSHPQPLRPSTTTSTLASVRTVEPILSSSFERDQTVVHLNALESGQTAINAHKTQPPTPSVTTPTLPGLRFAEPSSSRSVVSTQNHDTSSVLEVRGLVRSPSRELRQIPKRLVSNTQTAISLNDRLFRSRFPSTFVLRPRSASPSALVPSTSQSRSQDLLVQAASTPHLLRSLLPFLESVDLQRDVTSLLANSSSDVSVVSLFTVPQSAPSRCQKMPSSVASQLPSSDCASSPKPSTSDSLCRLLPQAPSTTPVTSSTADFPYLYQSYDSVSFKVSSADGSHCLCPVAESTCSRVSCASSFVTLLAESQSCANISETDNSETCDGALVSQPVSNSSYTKYLTTGSVPAASSAHKESSDSSSASSLSASGLAAAIYSKARTPSPMAGIRPLAALRRGSLGASYFVNTDFSVNWNVQQEQLTNSDIECPYAHWNPLTCATNPRATCNTSGNAASSSEKSKSAFVDGRAAPRPRADSSTVRQWTKRPNATRRSSRNTRSISQNIALGTTHASVARRLLSVDESKITSAPKNKRNVAYPSACKQSAAHGSEATHTRTFRSTYTQTSDIRHRDRSSGRRKTAACTLPTCLRAPGPSMSRPDYVLLAVPQPTTKRPHGRKHAVGTSDGKSPAI